MGNKTSIITFYIGFVLTAFGIITIIKKKRNHDNGAKKGGYFFNTYVPIVFGLICVWFSINGVSIFVFIKKVLMYFMSFFSIFMERL